MRTRETEFNTLEQLSHKATLERESFVLHSEPACRDMRKTQTRTHYTRLQACVMIGDIDVVAPIETAFFCLSYAMCNITCFVLSSMGAPNWRCGKAWKGRLSE